MSNWGAAVSLAGAILAAFGAFVAGRQQDHQRADYEHELRERTDQLRAKAEEISELNRQLAAKNDELARLARQGLDTITGADSFCTLHVTDIEDRGVGTLRIRHHGAFPLYDVVMTIAATQAALDAGRGMKLLVGTMAPGTVGILRHGHGLGGNAESKDIFVRFSARNGAWTQVIALRRVGSDWKTSTETHRKVGSAATQIFAETEEGFPK
jgi:hypothetical protein